MVNLHVEFYEHGELAFEGEPIIEESDLAQAILLLSGKLFPVVAALEADNGDRTVIAGAKFLKAIVLFVKGELAYPVNGEFEALRGKRFNQLERMTQREIKETAIPLHLMQSSLGSEAKAEFRAMVSASVMMSM